MTMFSVGIAPSTYDPIGGILLKAKPDSELSGISRRVARTATLDGKATIEDMGYTASDSTLNVNVIFDSQEEEEALVRIIQIFPTVIMSTQYGCFLGVADFYKPSGRGGTVRFLVSELLS